MNEKRYTKDHEWVELKDKIATVGISNFAQESLGDIVFIELPPTGKKVKSNDEISVVESGKAASDIYSPLDGEIIQMDAPEDLYDRPLNTFVASFIGTPKINLIRGELFLLKTQWVFRNRDIEIIVPDNHYQKNNLKAGSVLMGLRPEDVYDMNFTQIKNQSHHFDLIH